MGNKTIFDGLLYVVGLNLITCYHKSIAYENITQICMEIALHGRILHQPPLGHNIFVNVQKEI